MWRPASSPLNTSTWAQGGDDYAAGGVSAAAAAVAAGAAGENAFATFHRDLVDSFSSVPAKAEEAIASKEVADFGDAFHSLQLDQERGAGGGGRPGESRSAKLSFAQREAVTYAHQNYLQQPQHRAVVGDHHADQRMSFLPQNVHQNGTTSDHPRYEFPSSSVVCTSLSADECTLPTANAMSVQSLGQPRSTQSSSFVSTHAPMATSAGAGLAIRSPPVPATPSRGFNGGVAIAGVSGNGNGNAYGNGSGHGNGNGNGSLYGHGNGNSSGRSRSAQRRRRRPNGDSSHSLSGHPQASQHHQHHQQHQQNQHPHQQRSRNGYQNSSQPQSAGNKGGRRPGGYGNTSAHVNGSGRPMSSGTGNNGGESLSVREYNRRISNCARRRDLNGALQALADVDSSPNVHRNLFTYNAVINALVMCSQYSRADELWGEMIASGIQPNLVTYNTRLKSCFTGTDADVERAFGFVREMEANSVLPDRVTYNSLINSCVAAGRVDDARDVYEEMQRKRIVADDFTFTTLAKAGASQNNIEMLDALLIHQLEHHTNLRQRAANESPSTSVGAQHKSRYNGGSGGTSVSKFGANGNKLNINTNSCGSGAGRDSGEICPVAYNAIADAYIRCGHAHRALDLLDRMRDPKSIVAGGPPPPSDYIPVAPDVQSFNVKLKALREAGASTKEAFVALEDMQALSLETDHISLLTLADLCCRRGEMGLAEGVLRVATGADLREAELGSAEWSGLASPSRNTNPNGGSGGGHRRNNNQPRNAKANASLFNALIRGYSSLDPPNVDAALALYAEMKRFVDAYGFHFYAPDSVTYTMLVDSFARVGDTERAERIISEMEAAGPGSTSVVAFNAFLKANRSAGSGKAFEILERIKSRGLTPDLVTINQLVDILSSEPNGLKHAERLVGDMPKWNLSPDLHTYNCLIKAAARSKGFNQNAGAALNSAFHWLRELRKNNLRADEFTYQSMTAACAAAGDAPRALQFFRCVEEERARRLRGVGGSLSGSGSGSLSSGAGTGGSTTNRSASAGNISELDRSGSGDGTGGESGKASELYAGSDPTHSIAPSRVDAPPGLSRAGQSVGANLMMLGSHASLMESSVSASNTSNSRNGSGGNTAGSSSSQESNDDFLLLAHPAAYVALMRAFLSSGREDGIDATLRLRDEMVDRGLELGRSGYTAVADAYAERGDSDKVEETLREMVARESEPGGPSGLNPVHHSIRMKSLCKQGRIDEAIALLPEVENPDAGVFNTLLFAVGRNKDKHRMVTILRAMENAGIEPDAITGRAMQPLMRSLARALRSFDDRFQDRITNFVCSDPMGGASFGGSGDSSSAGSGTPESPPDEDGNM